MKTHTGRVRGNVVLFVLLGLILSLAAHVGAAAAQSHWVTFVLQDEKTNASLNGVDFSFSGPGFNKRGVANGLVKLGPLVSGRFMVSFKKSGYFDFNSGLDVTANRSFTITLAKQADVQAVVPPQNALTVWPLAENGRADLSGAKVTVTGPSGQKSITVTKQVFAAVFYDLKPGRYTYTVSHSNYQPASGTVDMGSTSKPTLKVNLTANQVPVTVQVADDRRAPIFGAKVIVQGAGQGTLQGQTDINGRASFHLSTGSYAFTATANGHQPATTSLIQISPGKEIAIQLVALKGPAQITVSRGNPPQALKGAAVSLTGPGGALQAVTDSKGVAAFKDLPLGTYRYKVRRAGFQDLDGSFQLSSNLGQQHAVTLTPVPLSRGALTVKLNSLMVPKTLQGVKVKVWSPATGYRREAVTDNWGQAHFPGLPYGQYRCSVSDIRYQPDEQPVAVNKPQVLHSTNLSPGQPAFVVGVVDPAGKPVRGAKVMLGYRAKSFGGSKSRHIEAWTDAGGIAFFYSIPKGSLWRASISAPGYRTFWDHHLNPSGSRRVVLQRGG